MRFGVQSFGALKSNKEDLPVFFKNIREMGYQLFEPCISFFEIPGFDNIWNYEKYDEYDRMIKEADLKVLSCHIFSQNLFEDSKKIIKPLV
jgi:sugar phosphate isomerase/epimerase